MSCADKDKCFTLTWEIENFDIFLRTSEEGLLLSPAWKTYTTEGKTIEWQVLANHSGPNIYFRLISLNETWIPDRCETSATSSCGKILSTCPQLSFFQSVHCMIQKKEMFVNKMQSNIPLNRLTVEFKMWWNSMKNGGFRIHSVVKKVLFRLCIENFRYFSPSSSHYSHTKIIEKDDIRINMSVDTARASDQYDFCLQALPIKEACFSFVYCNIVCDCIAAIKTQKHAVLKYNDLRSEYREEWRIAKQSGVTRNASCKFNLQLDIIVAFHNYRRYQITQPTSSQIVTIGDSSEAAKDPLKEDLLQLYRESIVSDVTINAQGKSFSAHRSILAARSPVFRAMFEKDEMIEGQSGVVDIDDVDSPTVDRMLAFLYGDSLQGLRWGEVASLYYAADKYNVQALKQMCADILKAGLTEDNVCDALVLADMHSDEELMKSVVDFIYGHQEVVSSPNWQQLEESSPRLVQKITKELFLKRVNK